jgi:prepilin-type N-terminal cleavage/methylation domain-containing protein
MHAPASDPPKTAGFTLVETLVALVILSTALFAFYDFLASALSAARAAERAATAYDLRRNALALAATLNPMETPEGTFDLGSYRIRWRAEPIGAMRQSGGFPSGKGRFTIGLYRVVLDFPEERRFPGVEVTKLGYHLEVPSGRPLGDATN